MHNTIKSPTLHVMHVHAPVATLLILARMPWRPPLLSAQSLEPVMINQHTIQVELCRGLLSGSVSCCLCVQHLLALCISLSCVGYMRDVPVCLPTT